MSSHLTLLPQSDWKPTGAFELPYSRPRTRSVTARGGDPIESWQLSLLLVGLDSTTYPCFEAAVACPADSAPAASSVVGKRTICQLELEEGMAYLVQLLTVLRTAHPNPLHLVNGPEEEAVVKETCTLEYQCP